MPEEISLAEYLKLQKPKNKYFAEKTEIDGYWFDSKREGERYLELKILERCGAIKNLRIHPPFPLIVNDQKICDYEADFAYIEIKTGQPIVEDVKSKPTRVKRDYRIKLKLFRAIYGRDVMEIM